MAEVSALGYYKSLSNQFDLWDAEGNSPADGQVIFNKETWWFWAPLTFESHPIGRDEEGNPIHMDFDKFVKGQLESRKESGESA